MRPFSMPQHSFQVVHHMAALDTPAGPPNSLAAIAACLDQSVDVIEVDITALADQDFLLVHDDRLELETTGKGAVADCSTEAARTLHIRQASRDTDHPAALLSDVVAQFVNHAAATELQLDLKSVDPGLPDEVLGRLVALVAPLGRRVIVSSGADWHLRALRRLAPMLRLGFDPMWRINWAPDDAQRDPREFPRRRGAYGYLDDHLLASERRTTPARYLEQRCGELLRLVPAVDTFYMHYGLVAQSLADGFNWAEALRTDGVRLDVWTVDVPSTQVEAAARRLHEAGVALFTSNTPQALRALLT